MYIRFNDPVAGVKTAPVQQRMSEGPEIYPDTMTLHAQGKRYMMLYAPDTKLEDVIAGQAARGYLLAVGDISQTTERVFQFVDTLSVSVQPVSEFSQSLPLVDLRMHNGDPMKAMETEQERDLHRRIRNFLLLDLGMPANCRGYHYIHEAVYQSVQHGRCAVSYLDEVYTSIAEYYETNLKTVQRQIREAISLTFRRGNSKMLHAYFPMCERHFPSVSEFICTVIEIIRT